MPELAHIKLQTLWQEHSVVIAFAVLCLLAGLASEHFWSLANGLNILRQVSIIGIIALGMTVVIISGGIDLSVGSVLALIGAAALTVLNAWQSVPLAILAALAAGGAIGFANGTLISKGKIPPFIATLGAMAAARSLVLYAADGGSISGEVESYTEFANGQLFGISYPIYAFIVVGALLHVVMTRTRFGRYVYAIGSNETAARLSAIRVDVVKIGVYVLAGTTVAIASVIESSRLSSVSSASSGVAYELDAIAAVIVGGTRMSGGRGHIFGTFIGVLILGVLNNTLNLLNVSPYLQGLVKGGIIIVAVLLQKKES